MSQDTIEARFERFRRGGEVDALGAVFDAAAPELQRVALHLCRGANEAEDVVQATFLAAIQKAASWDGERALMPWLVGILTNKAKQLGARAARRPEPERVAEGPGAAAPPGPAAEAAAVELRELIDRSLERLPETYAPAVREHLLEGRSAGEIASRLGISANAASVRMHRGLKLLRGLLPAGAALGAAGALTPARGFGEVRRAVLEAGAERAATGGLVAAKTVAMSTSAAWVATGVLLAGGVVLGAGALLGNGPDESGGVARAQTPAALDSGRRDLERSPLAPAQVAVPTAGAGRQVPDDAPESAQLSTADWLAKFEARPDWRGALSVGYEIAALPPDEALEVMRDVYPRLPEVHQRQQVLKPFAFAGGHVHVLEVLDLAAQDPSLEVQGWAFDCLKGFALRDFSVGYEDYRQWRLRTAGRPLGEVLEESTREAAARLLRATPDELARELGRIDEPDARVDAAHGLDRAALLRDSGLAQQLLQFVESGALVESEAREALAWVAAMQLPEADLRARVLPLLESDDADVRAAALGALGRRDQPWVSGELIDRMAAGAELRESFAAARAIASVGDPQAIPALISLLAIDDTEQSRYAIGYYGLSKLTGVDWDESMDAAWWQQWWLDNRERMPESIRGAELEAGGAGATPCRRGCGPPGGSRRPRPARTACTGTSRRRTRGS